MRRSAGNAPAGPPPTSPRRGRSARTSVRRTTRRRAAGRGRPAGSRPGPSRPVFPVLAWLAPLFTAVPQVVHQRVHAGTCDVGIPFQIAAGIEARPRITSFAGPEVQEMPDRVHAALGDIRI